VHSERALVEAATRDGAPALGSAAAQQFVDELAASGIELGVDQAAAVRGVLTSGARIESLVGPAGTGKSFVVGTIAKAWQDPAMWGGPERRVFGLAASQILNPSSSAESRRSAQSRASHAAAGGKTASSGEGVMEHAGLRIETAMNVGHGFLDIVLRNVELSILG